jgi:hypothetical protein
MIRNWFFMRRHKRDCATLAARELALAGVAKRKREVRAVARQIRRELGMPDDPRLSA